ncbi:MAG TPA: hypothetical protein VKZ18_04835 [Polyangia bacterium]|nr:hypothetical protein [Polyangia bacterium]
MQDRRAAALGGAIAALVAGAPFFLCTTFIGDDHLFLTFARHVGDPLLPFVRDLHGGEYYRPLWMLLWWPLGRAASVPLFALAALALHAGAALLLAALLRALGRPPAVARAAALLMFLAPQNLSAALWFSATTDLLATVLCLAALLALVRGRRVAAAVAALAAFLAKESAFILPLLAALVLWVQSGTEDGTEHRTRDGTCPRPGRRKLWTEVAPQLALLAPVLLVRRAVLHGWGGSGDARAGLWGSLLQIYGGLAQTFTGGDVLPTPLAFALGTTILALTTFALARRGRGGPRWAPLLFAAVAAAPLFAAGWAVGARYFYLPAVGLCWAVAEAAAGIGPAGRITLGATLLLVGAAQAVERRQDVLSYERRVAAARRAVAAGLRAGHHVFHVDGGIKDLDLVVKEEPALEAGQVLVLTDVPASFVIVPAPLSRAAAALVAAPPIPPSGAYAFGDVRVVGFARRGDEPDLDEALARFPDLRFIRLRSIRGGQVIARDLTDEITRRLDGASPEGQD